VLEHQSQNNMWMGDRLPTTHGLELAR
jgi:hypothetical protein